MAAINACQRRCAAAIDQLMHVCTPEAIQQYWQEQVDKAQQLVDTASTSHQQERAKQHLRAAQRALASGKGPQAFLLLTYWDAPVSIVARMCAV